MEKWMCAKDVTELAVTVLMYGSKDKGRSKDGKWWI